MKCYQDAVLVGVSYGEGSRGRQDLREEVQLNCSLDEPDLRRLALYSLGFAIRELRRALIYRDFLRTGKSPKAGVAGSIPAGRTNFDRGSRESACVALRYRRRKRHL